MCTVVEWGWELPPGSPPDDAPRHDDERCVDGTRSAEAQWSFDLTSFATIDDDDGFALIPAIDGASTFRVVSVP